MIGNGGRSLMSIDKPAFIHQPVELVELMFLSSCSSSFDFYG